MKLKSLLSTFFVMALWVFFAQNTHAQCEYRLEMLDDYGDGWNGGILTITSGTEVYTFTLNNINDDGEDSTLYFNVIDNAPLVLSWAPGSFNIEVAFEVYDYFGNLVTAQTDPETGEIFSGTGNCPSCLKPANFYAENIYDNRVKLRWTPVGTATPAGWWVIYGPDGFVPGPNVGDTVYLAQPKATITGLTEKTKYDFYLRQDCGAGDVSDMAGPLKIETYWSDDVGVSAVVTPGNSCNLGTETVSIIMKNPGANPQSLVPFYYSVNGTPAAIPFPEDGLYTGVLGKDSCEVIEFDTQSDFSAPGEYELVVWTEMEGDDNSSNDTFVYRFVNRQIVPYEQGFELWSGAWVADTADSNNSSWELGVPDNTFISAAASGQHSWVTNLTGNYNGNEKSYLLSPCFDFSDAATDPVIEFDIIYDAEKNYDGAYLEMTFDAGATWTKVGAQGEGLNWYNGNNDEAGDVWDGQSAGWIKARHALTGSKGKPEVRLRFAFESDFGFSLEGVGIDNINLLFQKARDLYASTVNTMGEDEECGLQDDEITFRIVNLGSQAQNSYKAAYSVNGGAPVVENIAQPLAPDAFVDYTFNTSFDSRDGLYTIKCWAILQDEQVPVNDTSLVYTIDHRPRAVPFLENFEDDVIPEGWEVDGGTNVTDAHNNNSFVLANNLYSFNPEFTHNVPRYGVISAGDTLVFDYRITNYTGDGTVATILAGTDNKIDVEVSTDCGDTYTNIYTINSSTHTPTIGIKRIRLDLTPFAGESIKIRFHGVWDDGDYWVDFDNINIRACGENMALSAEITNAAAGQSNGKAKVIVGAGNPPYTYVWSSGATSQTANNLSIGTYSVSVQDSKGCTDVLEIQIGNSPIKEIDGLTSVKLQPNPTTGHSTLFLNFDRPMKVNVQVLNLLGQVLWETTQDNATEMNAALDLTAQAKGLYLIKVTAGGNSRIEKLVKGE